MKTFLMADFKSVLGTIFLVIVGSTIAVYLLLKGINAYFDRREEKRRGWLRNYVFPESCYLEVQKRYPYLISEQLAIAFEQLRLYFEVCLVYSSPSSSRLVAMPSKLVDTCWHAFISETRAYQAFCKSVFGSFLHHESTINTSFPFVDISANDIKKEMNNSYLKVAQTQQVLGFENQLAAARIYHGTLAISEENNSFESLQIPLLFSIDQVLNIEDGYFYASEVLEILAKFDLKAAEALVTKRETEAAAGSSAACGDGGSCGGCGGSI